MVDQDNELEAIECVLNDTSVEPIMLSYAFLRNVTNNFSEIIGSGGFGTVYMGVVRNWKLAVKKLSENHDFSDKQFEEELRCLIRVRHKNIVRFLGYCSDTQRKMLQHNGRLILADIRQRFLCFEYAPNKSLRDYLKDKSNKLEWETRYRIIEGICQGLCYLHIEERISHLDLKPDNILLDKDMVPKIADFGLSRRFSGEYSRITTKNIRGTLGYTAPEYLINGEISFKADIFSLGVIIKQLLIGSIDLSDFDDWYLSMDNDIYYPKVKRCVTVAQLCMNNEPRKRPTIDYIIDMLATKETMIEMDPLDFGNLSDSSRSTLGQVGLDLSQLSGISSRKIERSSEVILSPVSKVSSDDEQPMSASTTPSHLQQRILLQQKREMSIEVNISTSKISDEVQWMGVSEEPPQLQVTPVEPRESSSIEICPNRSSDASKLLDVYPLELHFPFMPNKRMKCRVSLTNRTSHYVGFWIIPTEPDTRVCFSFPRSPIFQKMEPHSSVVRTIIRKGQQQLLPQQDTCNFEVLMIVAELKPHLKRLMKSSIGINQNMGTEFLNRAQKLGCQVHRAMLTSVICRPESCQPIVTRQIIPTRKFGCVFSVDVHPIQTWILVGYATGFSILNYQTKETLMELRTNRVYSVKFIDRAQWFTIGYDNGYARVYTYTTMGTIHVKEFQEYHAKPVNLFVVHPTYPFLLSASNFDGSIKLWDWEKGWVCTRTFSVLAVGVLGLTFNQSDMNTFASVHTDGTAKVWNIQTSNPTATLRWGKPETKGYLFTSNHRYYVVTYGSAIYNKSNYASIWDVEKNQCVHRLAVSSQNQIGIIACHPTLPVLATRLYSGVVCLWDATTYRFDKMVPLTPAAQDNNFHVAPQHMILTGTNELTRLVVGCANEISVAKIYLPMVRADL